MITFQEDNRSGDVCALGRKVEILPAGLFTDSLDRERFLKCAREASPVSTWVGVELKNSACNASLCGVLVVDAPRKRDQVKLYAVIMQSRGYGQ